MDESGGRYVQVIADGSMGESGSFVTALAMGADAAMLGCAAGPAPKRRRGMERIGVPRLATPHCRVALRSEVGTVGTLQEILYGPSHKADGTTNFIGALRRAMASCGYVDIKSFQRCPVVVTANRS